MNSIAKKKKKKPIFKIKHKSKIRKKRIENFSPIEEKFFKEAQKINFPIMRQYQVGNYFLDFAYLDQNGFGFKIAIELDGVRYHSSYSQRQKDYERERYLVKRGWIVVRFTGSEINRKCEKCLNEVIDLIEFCNRKVRLYD